jgi:predicted TIM-barrel fold metal-dependent hydrolase
MARAGFRKNIQLHEGEQSLRHALEALGEDTLMFATDYPHSESWFPKSVEVVLGWRSISETARRKLLWDNAARCYARLGTRRPPPVVDPVRPAGRLPAT